MRDVTRRSDLQTFLPNHRAIKEWEAFNRRIGELEEAPGGGTGLGIFDLGGPAAPGGATYNMGDVVTYQTLQLRRGTAADWSTANPVLAEGEMGIDTTNDGFKIGDGVTAWNSLPLIRQAQIYVASVVWPGTIAAANSYMGTVLVPTTVNSLVAAPNVAGSRGKSLVAAAGATSITLRKNATTSANGTSVGTINWSAGNDVPTFSSAGFSLTGTDFLTIWGPASPDSALADITAALFFTRT